MIDALLTERIHCLAEEYVGCKTTLRRLWQSKRYTFHETRLMMNWAKQDKLYPPSLNEAVLKAKSAMLSNAARNRVKTPPVTDAYLQSIAEGYYVYIKRFPTNDEFATQIGIDSSILQLALKRFPE